MLPGMVLPTTLPIHQVMMGLRHDESAPIQSPLPALSSDRTVGVVLNDGDGVQVFISKVMRSPVAPKGSMGDSLTGLILFALWPPRGCSDNPPPHQR